RRHTRFSRDWSSDVCSSDLEVVMSGQVDRLERDEDGRVYVVDLKTGKHTPSRREAERHAQMGAYQLAVAHGAFEEGTEPGGAEQIGRASCRERERKTGCAGG